MTPDTWRRGRIALLFAIALSTLASAALARPPRYQLVARMGVGLAFNGAYLLGELDGDYRLLPALLVGASFETVIAHRIAGSGDACAEYTIPDCDPYFAAIGPHIEFQPFAESVVSPWAGAGVNMTSLSGPNVREVALGTTLDVGVDLCPTRDSAIGAYAKAMWFLTDPYQVDPERGSGFLDGLSLGLRVAGRF